MRLRLLILLLLAAPRLALAASLPDFSGLRGRAGSFRHKGCSRTKPVELYGCRICSAESR